MREAILYSSFFSDPLTQHAILHYLMLSAEPGLVREQKLYHKEKLSSQFYTFAGGRSVVGRE